jgi:hypothetical protein
MANYSFTNCDMFHTWHTNSLPVLRSSIWFDRHAWSGLDGLSNRWSWWSANESFWWPSKTDCPEGPPYRWSELSFIRMVLMQKNNSTNTREQQSKRMVLIRKHKNCSNTIEKQNKDTKIWAKWTLMNTTGISDINRLGYLTSIDWDIWHQSTGISDINRLLLLTKRILFYSVWIVSFLSLL